MKWFRFRIIVIAHNLGICIVVKDETLYKGRSGTCGVVRTWRFKRKKVSVHPSLIYLHTVHLMTTTVHFPQGAPDTGIYSNSVQEVNIQEMIKLYPYRPGQRSDSILRGLFTLISSSFFRFSLPL